VVRSLLGLEPDTSGTSLVSTAMEAPGWLAGFRWRGVRALGARWDVEVGRDGIIEIAKVVS